MMASIQRELSVRFALASLVGLACTCLAIYLAAAWSFGAKREESLAKHHEFVAHVLQESSSPLANAELQHKIDDYVLSRRDVRVVWSGDGSAAMSPKDGWLWSVKDVGLKPYVEGGPHQVIKVGVGIDPSMDRELLRDLACNLAISAAAGSVLLAALGAGAVRRGLTQLRDLARATAAVDPRSMGQRIDARRYAKELHPWITQFNDLLARVELAYGQVDAFNADVAHELRTPLANLTMQAELQLSEIATTQDVRDFALSQLEDLRRLGSIVTDMLFLSKADRGTEARPTGLHQLAAEADDVLDYLAPAIESAGMRAEVCGQATAHVDSRLVKRAIANLVLNAIQYGTPGTAVTVDVGATTALASITVRNRGAALPDETLEHMFERFYRSDAARAGSDSHHGLGLAIVAAIARMHGGSTSAGHRDGVTSITFTVALRQDGGV